MHARRSQGKKQIFESMYLCLLCVRLQSKMGEVWETLRARAAADKTGSNNSPAFLPPVINLPFPANAVPVPARPPLFLSRYSILVTTTHLSCVASNNLHRDVCATICLVRLHIRISTLDAALRYRTTALPSLGSAVEVVRTLSKTQPNMRVRVLVTGSLYLVGDAIKILKRGICS